MFKKRKSRSVLIQTRLSDLRDLYYPAVKEMFNDAGFASNYSEVLAKKVVEDAITEYAEMNPTEYVDWKVKIELFKLKSMLPGEEAL